MKSLASEIGGSELKTSSPAGKKTGKSSTGNGLSQLFSQLSAQAKSEKKSAAFKQILEPKKSKPDNPASQAQPAWEKKPEIFTKLPPPAVAGLPSTQHIQDNPKPLPELKIGQEHQSQNTKLPNPNIRPTIDPRSPMHNTVLGASESGKTLVTDGPKAKEKAAGETPKSKHQNELHAAPDNSTAKGNADRYEKAPTQNERVALEGNLQKDKPIPAEKARTSHKIEVAKSFSNNNLNSVSEATGKQNRTVQAQHEIAHQKTVSASDRHDVAGPAPLKTERNNGSAQSGQFTIVSNFTKPEAAISDYKYSASETGTAVAEQITSAVQAAPYKLGQKIIVNLNPPELGRISIKFEKLGDELIGRLEVEKTNTKSQIDINLPQIVQNLQDAGVQIKQFDVVVQDQSLADRQEFAGHAQPDRNGKHEFASDQNGRDVNSVLSGNIQPAHSAETDTYLNDKSVNILV